MNQHYTLGRSLHTKYDGILPLHYTPKDIYIRASGFDRCLMSAYCQLQGLFPPGSGPVIEGQTDSALPDAIQPIPIHSGPRETEFLLRAFDNCPNAHALANSLVLNTPAFRAEWQSHNALFAKLAELTGVADVNETNVFSQVSDALFVVKDRGLPLPVGMTDDMYAEVNALQNELFVKYFPLDDTYSRVSMGMMFNELLGNFKADVANTSDARRYRLYSAHDSTVTAFLHSQGYQLSGVPPYASSALIELWGADATHSEPYLKLFFNKNTQLTDSVPVKLYKCPDFECPVSTYEKNLRAANLVPEVATFATAVCGMAPPPLPTPTPVAAPGLLYSTIVLACLLLCAVAGLVVALGCCLVWRKRAAVRKSLGESSFMADSEALLASGP